MKVHGRHYRTIWPDPKHPEIIKIIDQRHLPHEFIIEDLKTVADYAAAIFEMHVRGAGLIGATAGFAMYCAALSAPEKDFDSFMNTAARKILQTRPTAKNLAWAVDRQIRAIKNESVPAAKRKKFRGCL